MHSLETIIARNQEAQNVYDTREAKWIKDGQLSIAEWSKILSVPISEVNKILYGNKK